MVTFDYVLIGVVALSTIVSLFRGFFKEAFSVVTWLVALWAAWRFGVQAAELIGDWGTSVMRLWVARLAIVIGVLLCGGLLNWLLGMLLHSTGLSGTDRVIGMIFGMARGVILVGILLVVMEAMKFDEEPWWWESKLIPYAAPVVDMIRIVVEDGQEFLNEMEATEDPPPLPAF